MEIQYGDGKTEFGPGVSIDLSGAEVALAIYAWLVAQNVHINGARTVTVNGDYITSGNVYVDPSAFVLYNGEKFSGRGPELSNPVTE